MLNTLWLPLSYTLVFVFLAGRLRFFRLPGIPPTWYPVIFLLKVAAGMALTWVYTRYYTDRQNADIYKYFDDAKVMYGALREHPADYFRMLFGLGNDTDYFTSHYYAHMNHWARVWETVVYNDNHTIIRWNAFVMLFSGGNFHVHTVFMCLFSFTGTHFIYKALQRFLAAHQRKIFLILLFLMPSYLFWTSGVLKEGLLIFGAGIALYLSFEGLERNLKWFEWLFGAMAVYLLIHLKAYFLVAFVPAWIAYVICCKTGFRKVWLVYGCVIGMCLLAFVLLPYFNPDYHMGGIFKQKQDDFYRLSEFMKSGSIIAIPRLDGSYVNLLLNSVPAFFNGLLRPFPGESFSPLILMASAETVLIILTMVAWIAWRPALQNNQRALFIMLLLYIAVLSVLSGWVTPVLGAMVRYRVPCWPFIVFFTVWIIPQRWIPQRLQA